MLYRYYSKKEYLIDVIKNNRFFCNTVGDFNDPLEQGAYVKDQETGRYFFDPDIKRTTRLCCFSQEEDNFLLWSHYADKHRGFCIGMDFGSISDTIDDFLTIEYKDDIAFIKDISYSAPIIEMDVKTCRSLDKSQAISVLTHKFPIWAYEKETRLIKKDSNYEYFSFPEYCLNSITAGVHTPREIESEIKNRLIATHPKAEFRKCFLKPIDGTLFIDNC